MTSLLPIEIKILEAQDFWQNKLEQLLSYVTFEDMVHIHLNFQGSGLMRRLFLLSVALCETSFAGKFLFLTWNATPFCPGYLHTIFQLDPIPQKFPGRKGIPFRFSPFWKIIDLTPKIAKITAQKEKDKEKEKVINPKHCQKCFGNNQIILQEIPRIYPLREFFLGICTPGKEEQEENVYFKTLRKEDKKTQKMPYFCLVISFYKFLFQNIPLEPNFEYSTQQYANSIFNKNQEKQDKDKENLIVGLYIHSSIWFKHNNKSKDEALTKLKKELQKQESKICVATDCKTVEMDIHRLFGFKVIHFFPGELPTETQKLQRSSSIWTTMQHCLWLANCSRIFFYPSLEEVDGGFGAGAGFYFRCAVQAVYELLQEKKKKTPFVSFLPYSFPFTEISK
jgi:hypothetical protein